MTVLAEAHENICPFIAKRSKCLKLEKLHNTFRMKDLIKRKHYLQKKCTKLLFTFRDEFRKTRNDSTNLMRAPKTKCYVNKPKSGSGNQKTSRNVVKYILRQAKKKNPLMNL